VEREAGKPAVIMGFMGITEGAIPFAAADPVRVIPAIMFGSAVAAILSLWFGATPPRGAAYRITGDQQPFGYIASIIAGTITTAVAVKVLKTVIKPRA
jgi:fructose-specific PTS system IIC-like component